MSGKKLMGEIRKISVVIALPAMASFERRSKTVLTAATQITIRII